jgi:ABC-type Fe3+-hydroxamate transport system substrate-binding protein
MEPVGTVTPDKPPETVLGERGFAADVITALGHGKTIKAMKRPSFWYNGFYDELPGVQARNRFDIPKYQTDSHEVKREYLFGLNADLFAVDPNILITSYGLSDSDVKNLNERVAPFFGNDSRDERGKKWPNYPTGDSYPYYTIPEFVEMYGNLFGEQERAGALVEFYERTLDDILSRVPDETRTIALLSSIANPNNFGYWGVNAPIPDHDKPTYSQKQYRDLGVEDAFEGEYGGPQSESEDLQIDSEKLAAVDPDIIFFSDAIRFLDVDDSELQYGNLYEKTKSALKSDPVTKGITAVQEGNLYVGGTADQGPIINLFQTEMLAKQLYPETFGEWHGVGETPAEEELVDRDRLAEIITGSA